MDPSRNGPWWARLARAAFTLDARSLAVYRMALGAIVCTDCVARARDFDLMFAIDGVFPPAVIRRQLGGPTAWSLAWMHDSNAWNAAVLALEGVAGILLVAGLATRLATAAAWVAVVSVYRRTYPAANAGDAWLACQLFWAMFIPLGAAWSWDARRREGAAVAPPAFCSVATAALVLQLVAVYVSAGIAKCNPTWLDGTAVATALSVHNFGSTLGMAWADAGLFGRPLARAVVLLEIAVPPLLLLRPTPRVRLAVAAAFTAFHAAIWLLMSVGLFVPISLAAWLPILPAEAWRRGPGRAGGTVTGLSRPATWTCGAALAVAALSLVHARWLGGPPPRPLAAVVDLTARHQDWPMFGTVPPVEQWVSARATLADGAVVDLMRGGRPCGSELPDEGFTSLPHHRWHKLCWVLTAPGSHDLAVAVAAGLARRWNATHAPAVAVRSVEIRHAVQRRGDSAAGEYEHIVASWPTRTPAGDGNLERFLQATAPQSAASDDIR